ncbi:MAG: hypothetical protein ABSE41_12685 [Bacteroidota bacterium]|jgi:hypothetical protein
MNDTSHSPVAKRPFGVSAIAIINGIAFFLTLAFWGTVAFKKLVPFPSELTVISERANAAVTWGFLIGDIAFSAPLLLIATMGLWRPSALGWTAAQMVNILWVYSMTVVLMRDAFTVFSPGGMLFLPFALNAVWATIYLWKHRSLFWKSEMISLQSTS